MSDDKGDDVPEMQSPSLMASLFGGAAAGLSAGLASKMSQRDLFAAAALQGLLADVEFNEGPANAARMAVGYADALIVCLSETPHPLMPKKETP